MPGVPARLTDRLTPLGWLTLLVAVVTWAIGVIGGWPELLRVAGAALVLVVACVLVSLVRSRVGIDLHVAPVRSAVGGIVQATAVVTNHSRMRLLPLLVELPVGPDVVRLSVPSLAAGGRHTEHFDVPTSARGIVRVGPATSVQGDPLGLARRRVRWTGVVELVVHPRTTPIATLGFGLVRDLEGTLTEHRSSSDLAFHALREYQPGDDRRHIHWRSSARSGQLQVRQYLDTRRSHVTVVVDTELESYAEPGVVSEPQPVAEPGLRSEPGSLAVSGRDLETAFCVATSLVLRVLKDRQEASLVCGDLSRHTVSAADLLDDMARARPQDAPLGRQVAAAARLAPETSVAFLVTGPRRSTIELDRALTQFGAQVRPVVIVVGASSHGVRQVGGLLLLSLGDLADLPALLGVGLPT